MNKKIVSLLLATLALAACVACSNSNGTNYVDEQPTQPVQSSQPVKSKKYYSEFSELETVDSYLDDVSLTKKDEQSSARLYYYYLGTDESSSKYTAIKYFDMVENKFNISDLKDDGRTVTFWITSGGEKKVLLSYSGIANAGGGMDAGYYIAVGFPI